MDIFVVLSLSIAPGIFWLWFFYKKDRLEPEPKSLVIRMFFFGMLALIPAILIQYPLRQYRFIQVIIAAPVIEELLKFIVVRVFIFKNVEFDEPMDGIVYAVSVALGFASVENAYYILSTYLAPQIALGASDPMFGFKMVWKLYLLRALLTVPGHAIWSGMWGYALGRVKFIVHGNTLWIITKGLLLSIILHSLFNYCITNFTMGAIGMLILIPAMWRMIYKRIDSALKNSPHDSVDKNSSNDVQE